MTEEVQSANNDEPPTETILDPLPEPVVQVSHHSMHRLRSIPKVTARASLFALENCLIRRRLGIREDEHAFFSYFRLGLVVDGEQFDQPYDGS